MEAERKASESYRVPGLCVEATMGLSSPGAGDTLLPKRETNPKTANPLEEPSPQEASSQVAELQGVESLPQPPDLSQEVALTGVIERLRTRVLPGRDPGYCQMSDTILSQLQLGTSATILLMGVPDEPPTTATLAPLVAVLGEALPQPVLALDARPDRTELAECFGLACRWGLGEVLAGQVGVYEAVRKTSLGQLFILGRSSSERFSWLSLSEETWASLIRQLRRHYRLILIDGGPHPHPAEKQLVDQCDGVYLVVHLGRTPKGVVRSTVEELSQAGARVLGCIAATTTARVTPRDS